MEKSEVIKLRETLRKTGSKQNTPLRVFSNNSFTIIDEDYIYFTNIRLINFGMEEAIKNIRYAQTEYNCAYYYSNSPYYQYNGLIDAPEGGNVQKIIATAMTKMKAWETVYQCFQSLSLGNDPKWVFQYIRGNDNNILKSL